MTIDEAIAHAKKTAEKNRAVYEFECSRYGKETVDRGSKLYCVKCAEENEQLAGWLEQLKRLRRLKEAMDSFVESVEVWCYLHEGEYDQKGLDELLRMVEEIKRI